MAISIVFGGGGESGGCSPLAAAGEGATGTRAKQRKNSARPLTLLDCKGEMLAFFPGLKGGNAAHFVLVLLDGHMQLVRSRLLTSLG